MNEPMAGRVRSRNRKALSSSISATAAGPALSPIVAGVWRLADWGWTPPQRLAWIEQCIELGVTSFDHADIYGGYTVEALFGEALALAPGLRQRMQIVTKCGIKLVAPARPSHRIKSYDSSRAHLLLSVENSLRALGTDRIDLLLIHRPDALMDAAEVAGTVAELKRAGKVLHFGVSNFTPAQFELLDAATPLATNQIELHPLHLAPLADGTLDQAQRLQRRPMIWSPLAGGRLLGGDESAAAQRVRWVLGSVAARLGTSPATVAYAWLLRHPSKPLPLVGSRRIEAMHEALAALTLPMDAETWYEIWQAGAGREVA
jgi:predicted oxidoreductase